MRIILAVVALLLISQSASADTCSAGLMPQFTAAQANEICSGITSPTISGKISGVSGVNASTTLGYEGVTGTGSVTGDAAVLSATKQFHQLIGANGTLAWKFATPVAGDVHIFLNTTAAVARFFPQAGGTINGAAADAVFAALTGIKPIVCIATSTTAWICS